MLLQFDAQGNVVGNVAEKYDLSPEGLTWTFNIRKGIKFHNGDPLTAADVVFSLQRFGSKESTNPWSPYILKNNESITAADDSTVIFKAQKPEWPLKIPFATTPILPKNYFDKVGQDGFRAQPVGSGPYKFAKWVPKTSMEMDANTEYWGATKPQWAHITETLVPEEATRVAQLERGDVDMIGNLSFDRLTELKGKGFRLQEVGLPTLANISLGSLSRSVGFHEPAHAGENHRGRTAGGQCHADQTGNPTESAGPARPGWTPRGS